MRYTGLIRCLALLMALAVALPAALAEETWLEAPMLEAVVPELEEAPLPAWDAPDMGEMAVEALPADGTAPASADVGGYADPGAMAVSAPYDAAPVLAVGAVTLGVKESCVLGLLNGADPASIGAVFVSSNPKIAAVDAATGQITGKKAGNAVVTVTALGVQSSCAVTVLKAPKKIALSAKKLTLGVGEETWLAATLTANTASAVTFSSSNEGVVIVGGDGHLVAVGTGTATVTARTFNKKKATCKVTVMAAPEYIALSDSMLSLWQGRSYDLKPTLSPGSGGGVYCASSDPSVVSVSGTTIRAESRGAATVTVSTYNGRSASMTVQVTKSPVYRAMLVGGCRFPGTGMSNLPGDKDVAMVANLLSSVSGPSGSGWQVSRYTDLTAAQIHQTIRGVFAGAEEGDVSLFYISTHGDEAQSFDGYYPEFAGYLQVYPDYRYSNWYDRNTMTLVALAAWLSEVPGQVVVMIDSCGSGAAVYNAKGVSGPAYSPESFDAAVVEAFMEADKGVLAPGVDQGAFVLENKFYVLTSTDYQETGWSLKGKYSYFSKWLGDSVKTKGRMPADADKNRMTTLNELYRYMSKLAAKKVFKYHGASYQQHIQVYPANSGFELFRR